MAIYRLSHAAWRSHLLPIAEVLRRVNQLLYGVDIAYQARIAPGFSIVHPSDIVIGRGVVVGRDAQVFNGVTLGNRLTNDGGRHDGFPTIEDNVIIGTGAKILGPIVIGAGTLIGANAVVAKSVPCHSRVIGPKSEIRLSDA